MTNGFGQPLTYTYDAVGNRIQMLDSLPQNTFYRYDIQNRLTNGYGQVTTIGYDALDRELTKIYGNSMILTHAYDQAGRETARQYLSTAETLVTLPMESYSSSLSLFFRGRPGFNAPPRLAMYASRSASSTA